MLGPSQELVLEILDFLAIPLAIPAEGSPDHAALSSCSLVCKSWSTISQRLLFRRVVIDDTWLHSPFRIGMGRPFNRTLSFHQAITADTPKSRWLRDCVQSLVLRSRMTHQVMDILTSLPNLVDLDISGISCLFNDEEFGRLRPSPPPIRSLRVDTDHSGPILLMAGESWPFVVRVIATLPTLRMLEFTGSTFEFIPPMPSDVASPLGLDLVSFKFNSKWVQDSSSFLAHLTGGRTDPQPLQMHSHMLTAAARVPVDLETILSAYGPHLRSLSTAGLLKDPSVLSLCTRLERFECGIIPTDEIVDAIPCTITALCVTNVAPDYTLQIKLLAGFVAPAVDHAPVEYLIQQLETFSRLRVFTWVGPVGPGFGVLQTRCGELGVEFRERPMGSLTDDHVEISLRRDILRV
ncbi:hypothetical protein FB45DRAFT_932296 [Roridomyces roridus]|uniref:F-box domain-containing protein n=1 Tax=Roridomyces roridus TaxID=1738132 RepID=A0AAD7FGE5_9AGAR|nr:hypothetical protein FB45DRAFT_932296 [Roridomyces roridus]